MAYLPDNKDFYLEVAKGNVPKHSLYHLSPRNSNVGTVSEDCTPMSATYVSPTTYRTMNTVSSSANDASAGTGMRTMEITGVTLNGVESEVITLNGTTPVVSTKQYACILESEGETWGSGLANAGNITSTASTDATVQNVIPIGFNEAYSGVFMCPVGYKAYLLAWGVDFQNITSTTLLDCVLLKKNGFGGGWQYEDFTALYASGTSSKDVDYKGGLLIAAGRFIKTQVTSSITGSDVQVNYDILLVQD
jgi:hypothetical protein